MNPALLWGLAAALPAVLAEYLYRTVQGPWHHYLYAWVPIQMCIGYSIYRLVTTPGQTLVDSFVVFAFGTTTLRVLISCFILKEHIATGSWIALGLIVLAKISQAVWGR